MHQPAISGKTQLYDPYYVIPGVIWKPYESCPTSFLPSKSFLGRGILTIQAICFQHKAFCRDSWISIQGANSSSKWPAVMQQEGSSRVRSKWDRRCWVWIKEKFWGKGMVSTEITEYVMQAWIQFHPLAADAPAGSRKSHRVSQVGAGWGGDLPSTAHHRGSVSMQWKARLTTADQQFGCSYSVHIVKFTEPTLPLKIQQMAHASLKQLFTYFLDHAFLHVGS